MELYNNIKALRIQNGWSQEELAKRVGYNDRSSIAKIEAGKVDLAQSKILLFAEVFGVDPVELMGLGDGEEVPNKAEMSRKMLDAIIEFYRSMTYEQQVSVFECVMKEETKK